MKPSYQAYMRKIQPSEEFCLTLERKMKRALSGTKRRFNPFYAGVAAVVVLMIVVGVVVIMNRPAPEDNIVRTVPVVAEGGDADVPRDMTEERAMELVQQVDSGAKNAMLHWVYLDGPGAWVFYATKSSDDTYGGAFWYVREDVSAALSGPVDGVRQWRLIEGTPNIFTWSRLVDGREELSAYILADGTPVALTPLDGLAGIDRKNGWLIGTTAVSDCDYIYLALSGTELKEIAGTSVDWRRVRDVDVLRNALEGVEMEMQELSVTVEFDECIYWPANVDRLPESAHSSAGVIAVNMKANGADKHFYLCIDTNGDVSLYGKTGESYILDGRATAVKGAGLEQIDPKALIAGAEPNGKFTFEHDGTVYQSVHHMDEGSYFEIVDRPVDTSPSFDNPTPAYVAYEAAEDDAKGRHLAACPLFWLYDGEL